MKKIKTLILTTGQQIIGKIEEEGEFITVESPRGVVLTGKGILESFPFPAGTAWPNGTIKILINHVVIMTDIEDRMERDYLSSVSGLTL